MDHAPEHRQFLRALGARVAGIRRDRGLTQERLSEMVEVDPQTIQRVESGRSAVSIDRMRVIAAALDVSLSDLFRVDATDTPTSTWSPEEIQLVAAYRAIPADRRKWAIRLIEQIAKD